MRIVRSLVSLAILSTALAQAQSSALRGIEVADINRGADPCADFYEFANGRWRAANDVVNYGAIRVVIGHEIAVKYGDSIANPSNP
jgi:predicted metalloendopeptidase